MGTTGTTWGGDHGDHSHGDHMGTFLGQQGQCGDDVGTMGTTWGPQDHGDNMGWRPQRPRRPQPWGPHGNLLRAMGDDVGMTGTMWGPWGQCGDHGDNEITKNAITFE